MQVTKAQVKASLRAILGIADTIRELGEVPSGVLYSHVMGVLDHATYESFIRRLVDADLVQRRGDMLVWIG